MIQLLHFANNLFAEPGDALCSSNTPSVLCHIPLLVSHTTEKKRQLKDHVKSVTLLSEFYIVHTMYVLIQNDMHKTTNSYTHTKIQYSSLLHTPQHISVLKVSPSGVLCLKTPENFFQKTFKNLKPHSTVLKLSTKTLSSHNTYLCLLTC
jgi:hypothetical protein